TSDDAIETQEMDLTVAPLRTLPAPSRAGAFVPVAGTGIASVGAGKARKCYQQIACWVGDMPVRFILVPYSGEARADRPFYIMQDKVWRSLYARCPEAESRGQKPAVGGQKSEIKLNGDWPVLGIDYAPAHRFAQWLGGPSGLLPLTHQWDAAA